MNKDEQKRYKKLQEDAIKVAGSFSLEKLTFPDLMLLLHTDPNLRALIRAIATEPEVPSEAPVAGHAAAVEEAAWPVEDMPAPAPVARSLFTPPAPPAPADALRGQLGPELLLLRAVQADAEVAAAWLGDSAENEGQQLVRLVACAAQWDLLAELWDKLAQRCKQGQRAAHDHERLMLRAALNLHNLRWHGRQARLVEVAPGTAYDYDNHQRGTATGNSVRTLWLPGLMNAGGQLQKKPLVQT